MTRWPFFATALVCLLAQYSAAAGTTQATGRYTIAYASFAPVHSEVFVADADGTNVSVFHSAPAQQWNASFSRDGVWVIFTSTQNGSADIYRAHPDGSRLERLTDDPAFDDQAALSPDGRKLAFVSTRTGHAQIWLLDLQTKRLRNLTNHAGGHFRPAWSPDGEWIAFSSDRDSPKLRRPDGFETIQRTEIYLMRADGSAARQLTHTGTYAGSPSFSQDGKHIVFYTASFQDVIAISDPRRQRATTQISVIDIEGGEVHDVTSGNGEKWSPRWVTPDSIGYSRGGPEGGLDFTTSRKGARGEINNPAWSSDGRRMLFHRDTGQAWPPVMDAWSPDARFRLLRTGIFPTFSPAGDRIAFTTGFSAFLHNGLMTASTDGSGRWLIHDDLEHNTVAPSWSPLGNLIAFGSGGAFAGFLGQNRQQISNIAVVAPDGSGFRLLTKTEGNSGFPSWSPDGKRIVFRLQDEHGKGLRIVDVETGQVTVLTDGHGNKDNFPTWSPKGDEISFSSDREDGDWEIYAIHPDGTGLRRITHIPGNDAHSSWSPDGEWLAFATGAAGFKDEMALHPHNPQSYGEVAVIRPDGSDFHILTDNPWEDATPRWAPLP
jgi:TolB protein